MPKWRCTFMFDMPKAGWAETFYLEKTTAKDCIPPCKNYAAVRVGGLGKHAKIEAVRVSSVDPPKIAVLEVLNYASPHTGSTHIADTPWQGVQVKISDVNEKYQRTQLFRGVPDVWITRRPTEGDFDLVTTPEVLPWKQSVISSLRANGFLFRARDAEGTAGVLTTVLGFGTSAEGGFVTFNTALPPIVNSYVTFNNAKDSAGARVMLGRHKIKSVVGQLVTTYTKVPTGGNPSDWSADTYRLKSTGYFGVYYGQLQRPSSRDTGRPFFLRRGRQPAAKK